MAGHSPVMDGYQPSDNFRLGPATSGIPVVFPGHRILSPVLFYFGLDSC